MPDKPLTEVRVPISLLMTDELLPSAKITWIALALDAHLVPSKRNSPSRLKREIGLSRPTFQKAVEVLTAHGWYSGEKHTRLKKLAGPWVTVSVEMIWDTSLSIRARLMLAQFQTTKAYKAQSTFRYIELAEELGLNVKTVRNAMLELENKGWLKLEQANQLAAISYSVFNPIRNKVEEVKKIVTDIINTAKFKGEAILRGFLTVVSPSDEHRDEATFAFLYNPKTGKQLYYDRYYLSRVAFEFHGTQHDHSTELFDEETVQKQKHLDAVKQSICDDRGITLIIIRPEELSLEAIKRKIGKSLPQRNLRCYQSVVEYLEWIAARYRAKVPIYDCV